MSTRASFRVLNVTPDFINIQDQDGRVSVTNDAEAVVAHLVAQHGDKRITYIDTQGSRDELKHRHGTFLGFAPFREHGDDE